MASCTRQVVITFDGPLITFVFDTGHRTSVFICCCRDCVSISSDAQFLFVAGYVFHKSCITSVGGNASGNLATYLGLIEDQIVTACVTGPAFDADYQAVLDRADVLLYTKPSAAQQILQNQLMLDLKAGGIFSQLDIFYVLANDGSDDFSRINWVDPTSFELVEVNAPTWTADQGWQGDGATEYLDTTWDASNDGVNYVRNSAHLAAWIRISDTGTGLMAGERTDVNAAAYLADLTGSAIVRLVVNNDESPGALDQAQATGFLQGNRSGAAALQNILNSAQVSNAQASTAVNTNDFFVLAANNGGVADLHYDGQLSVMAAGGDLLAEENDYFNAVNDYITAI